MNYRFLSIARKEFDDAIDWYESKSPGLGDDFLEEVYRTLQRILQFPLAFSRMPRTPLHREIRFLNVDRFDYLVVYDVLPSEVVVLGVVHAHSGGNPWRLRTP